MVSSWKESQSTLQFTMYGCSMRGWGEMESGNTVGMVGFLWCLIPRERMSKVVGLDPVVFVAYMKARLSFWIARRLHVGVIREKKPGEQSILVSGSSPPCSRRVPEWISSGEAGGLEDGRMDETSVDRTEGIVTAREGRNEARERKAGAFIEIHFPMTNHISFPLMTIHQTSRCCVQGHVL